MSPVVEKRRSMIINILYFAILLAVFYLVFKTFFWILLPFITAFLFASLLQRPVNFVCRKTPLKRGLAGTLSVLLLLGAVIALIFLIGIQLVEQVRGFYEYVTLKLQNFPAFCEDLKGWIINAISFLPAGIRTELSDNLTVFFDNLTKDGTMQFSFSSLGVDWSALLSKGGGVIKDTVVQIPSVLIGLVISIVSCVFMTSDYNRIAGFVTRQFSEKNTKKLVAAKTLAGNTLKKMVKAYSIIIVITTLELCIGLYILKFAGIYDSSFIIIISIIIAIIDIIPVLGTGTVLIPWALYSFVTSNIRMGIGLIIIYAVILVIRQIIEPKLVAGQVGLPPIVTIIAMYIGTKTLGVLGFFILPFGVILIKEFNEAGIIHLFKNPGAEAPDASDAPGGDSETDGAVTDAVPVNDSEKQ